LRPGNDGIPFPYLDKFKGELSVLYLDEAEGAQNLGEAADKLFKDIQNILLKLLMDRAATAGAVPLQLLDLSVHLDDDAVTYGDALAFKISFRAAAVAE
jgi:hypothetical protein